MDAAVQKIVSNGKTPGPELAEDRRRLVERVSQSELFQKSPRLREFLLYVAECTLANRGVDLREQVIEERVFGRKPGSQDTIVRVEARNLRKRLDLYFCTEGRDEPMLVVMPKGGYALDFPLRQQEIPVVASEHETAVPPNIETYQSASSSLGLYRRLCLGLALVAVIACAFAAYWYAHDTNLRKRLGAGPLTFPFAALFKDDRDVWIVTSDTGMLQISSLLHRRVSLDEYIARSYPGVPETNPPNLALNWNLYEFTDGREMAIAGSVLRHYASFGPQISLRSGHAVQLQDFKDHNAILIGSPISNPWAQLYEEKLNFQCELAGDGRIVFRNKSPRPDESKQYPTEDDIQHNRTYARVVFLPRTTDAGSTLLIAGTTAQSTQAAGELVVDQASLSRSLREIGIDPTGPPHFFEVLVRSSNFVGGAIMSKVVAWRVSSDPER